MKDPQSVTLQRLSRAWRDRLGIDRVSPPLGPEANVPIPQPKAADPQAPVAANPQPPGKSANDREAAIPAEAAPDAGLDAEIQRQNGLLAATGVALRLERRGNRLGLRGPLPCRRGSGAHPVQRLSLGLSADARGLEQARLQLRRLLQQLQQQRFRWEDWSQIQAKQTDLVSISAQPPTGPASHRQNLGNPRSKPRRRQPSVPSQARRPGQLRPAQAAGPPGPQSGPPGLFPWAQGELAPILATFEHQFFADPRRRRTPAGSRTTWTSAYLPYLRRLQQAAGELGLPLTHAPPLWLLEQVLESYPSASRGRQQCGTTLAALAGQQGITLPGDWSERAGGYGLHVAQFRQLPNDQEILRWSERIPNPGWRLAYGLMATYGLRNHEIFFSDLSALASRGDRVIRVLPTSKTGEHQIWPFQPEWVEAFELPRLAELKGQLPPVSTDLRQTTLQQVGRRVAEQFRRYGLPLTPYDLRHAWAVRTIHLGLPDTVAARMMGHSVAIHTRTYHHWITRRDQQQAVDAALARRQMPARSDSPLLKATAVGPGATALGPGAPEWVSEAEPP